MTAPEPVVQPETPEVPGQAEPMQSDPTPAEPVVEDQESEQEPSPEDELPEWVRKKIEKANREAKNLRQRLKEQEPMVTAAQEAERAKMSELDREKADNATLRKQLAARDTELLQSKFGIPDDYIEFIGDGTYEEKEARAAKVGLMVQSAKQEGDPNRPPTQRPVESLRPGASPTPPKPADNSYPASWRPASRES